MTTDLAAGSSSISRPQRSLLVTSAVMTYLLVTMGGIVCATRSTLGCPDWPGCFGQIVPPLEPSAIIEYTHRFIAALTTPLIVAAAVVGWRRTRAVRWVSTPPLIAIGLTAAVITFGAFAVLTGLPPTVAALDVGSALLVLALMTTAAVSAFVRYKQPDVKSAVSFRTPFARLALWTVIGVFFVLVTGVLVATSGSHVRCLGWPLYNEPLVLNDVRGWLLLARRLVAVLAAIMIAAMVVQTWRAPKGQAAIRRVAALAGILLLAEALAGLFIRTNNFAPILLVAYVAVAAALWAALVVLAVLAGSESRSSTLAKD